MEIVLLPQAEADRDYWKRTGNKSIMKRISALLADIQEHPFTGIGKPEPKVFAIAKSIHGLGIPMEQISLATGLSKEEIADLK